VVLIVWSFYEEEVDVMTTLAFVGHVSKYKRTVLARHLDLDPDPLGHGAPQ